MRSIYYSQPQIVAARPWAWLNPKIKWPGHIRMIRPPKPGPLCSIIMMYVKWTLITFSKSRRFILFFFILSVWPKIVNRDRHPLFITSTGLCFSTRRRTFATTTNCTVSRRRTWLVTRRRPLTSIHRVIRGATFAAVFLSAACRTDDPRRSFVTPLFNPVTVVISTIHHCLHKRTS